MISTFEDPYIKVQFHYGFVAQAGPQEHLRPPLGVHFGVFHAISAAGGYSGGLLPGHVVLECLHPRGHWLVTAGRDAGGGIPQEAVIEFLVIANPGI